MSISNLVNKPKKELDIWSSFIRSLSNVFLLIILLQNQYFSATLTFDKDRNVYILSQTESIITADIGTREITKESRCKVPNYPDPIDIKELGIKGDGSDEHDLLENIFNRGGTFLIKDMELITNSEIYIRESVNLKLYFINSKLTTNQPYWGMRSLIYANKTVKHIEISGGKFDGKNSVTNGLYLRCSHFIHNSEIYNIATKQDDNEYAVGIFVPLASNTNICSEIYENYIHDIFGWDDKKLTNSQGAARAIAILWNSDDRIITSYIERNKIDYITGEEGDALQIFDSASEKRDLRSHITIKDNNISRCNRRFIKGLASNLTITGNRFTGFEQDAREAYNGAVMVSAVGGAQNISITDNHFINYGGFYWVINVDGIKDGEVSNNKFKTTGANGGSRGLTLRVRNGDNVIFENNSIDSDAQFQIKFEGENPGNVIVRDNLFYVNEGNQMIVHFYGDRKQNIVFKNNIVQGELGNATTPLDAFLWIDDNTDIKDLFIFGNKIYKGKQNNASGNMIHIFGNSHIFSNIIIENNYVEGSEKPFSMGFDRGITFKSNIQN